MPIPHLAATILLAMLGALGGAVSAEAVHPQDGPHADLRIAVQPDGVHFSVGLNLAFIDEIDPIPRELPDAVVESEAARIRERLERFYREGMTVELDGVEVTPVLESFQFYTEPDEGMVALYPRMGARALIRSSAVLHYPAKALPDVVRVHWTVYPPDVLGADMEGLSGPDGGPPRMFIETQVTGEGVLKMHRFSEAEPVIEWRSAAAGGGIVFADVPSPNAAGAAASDRAPAGNAGAPAIAAPRTRIPTLSVLAGVIAVTAAFSLAVSLARGRRPWADVAVLVVGVGAAIGLRDMLLVELPGGQAPAPARAAAHASPVPSDEEAAAIFEALHTNLYRSFDYTDESDVYDALARSVEGPLLEELYTQIYDSLVQAEQDNMLGVVTGVEPLDVEVRDIHPATTDAPMGFSVRHQWRVAGTVYHWGHAHTRVIEYDADYVVTAEAAGWRLTGQTMHEQWRLDPGGFPEEI